MWEVSTPSMACRQASVPPSCGMLVYRLETSMFVTIALLGIGVFSWSEKRWGESLMYEEMVDTRDFIMWSRNDDTYLVGPLQPLTIGLMRVLVELLKRAHTLRSYFVCGMHVGMRVCVFVACFSHAFHYLSYICQLPSFNEILSRHQVSCLLVLRLSSYVSSRRKTTWTKWRKL